MKSFLYSVILSVILFIPFLNFTRASSASSVETTINYSVSMPFPSNHLFEVTLKVENYSPNPDGYIDFTLPAWRSGRYIILDFSSGVQEFSAEDNFGRKLEWHKTDKDTWRVKKSEGNSYTIMYKVFSNEMSMRTRGLNDECGFIDASAVLMFAEKLRNNSLVLKIIPFENWHVTTGLNTSDGSENSFFARNYDYLADCPLLIGNHTDRDFFINDKKFTVSFPPDIEYNADSVINNIRTVSKTVCDFWEDMPFEHYNYLLIRDRYDYGATEHINSSVFSVSSTTFTNKENYNRFLSNIAHEFFHTWNVKQLRPKGIDPYDFSKENYSGEFWIAEGITSYYQNIFMIIAGYLTPDKYLETIQQSIESDIERPGNYVQSLEESSFDAWIKHSGNTPNKYIAESDFYSKGSCVGLLLDLEIRHNSENKYSLDNVMKTMYKNFPLIDGGYTNDDFIKTCEQFNGSSLKGFFDSYLYSTDSLDWKKYLNYAGLNLSTIYDSEKPFTGISARETGDRLIISYVVPGSPAYKAGLDVNDEIIAMDGYRVRSSSMSSRISDKKEDNIVKFTVMREDKLREFSVILKNSEKAKYKIERSEDPDNLQEMIYESWLNAGK
ncbi:MAG TPA: PDZ domain-containing protein [Ignavibacteria bacterium]|mgnify:CR=1 FL=1|nr:PDZ domain-containing protein [Ignavibacteria bacterium]HMR40622.1 PDZ domain-containing protein [Ignavibacteria bacterium]